MAAAPITVAHLMRSPVHTLQPQHTLAHARRLMGQHFVRHLPVVDPSGVLVGIVSDRDLLQAVGRDAEAVSSLMTSEPLTVFGDTPAFEAVAMLLHHRVSALPVVDENCHVVGVVTDTDFLAEAYEALHRIPEEAP
jgi:CBS domain-containing protein